MVSYFFWKILRILQRVPLNFLIFCSRMDAKNCKASPFYCFRLCEIFKNFFFVLKLGILRPSTLFPSFFKDRRFLYAIFFELVFINDFSRSRFVLFGQVVEKLFESLTLGSPSDIAYLVFSSKVRNFLRKCLRSTASPLCWTWKPKTRNETVPRRGLCFFRLALWFLSKFYNWLCVSSWCLMLYCSSEYFSKGLFSNKGNLFQF